MHSGDQKDGGDHLRDAGSEPHRVVAVGGAGVAGNIVGDEFGGGRSLDKLGLVARRHDKARGVVLRRLGSVVRLAGKVVWPWHDRSLVGGACG